MQPPASATRTEQSKVARFICRPLSRSSSQLHGVWQTGLDRALRREGRSTSPAAAHQGLGYRLVQPVDSPMATDRPHWVPCDRLRRSWEGQPGQGAPERRDPSQPRRDVWGTLDRLASPISLTLSHLAPTRGLVRNGGAVPAFQVGMSEGVKV